MKIVMTQKLIDRIRKKHLRYECYKSYSQCGEDMCLRAFLNDKCKDPLYKGFYVDIGAHHPIRYSNTNFFYNIGWRGINVDAQSDAIKEFNKKRPRDININVGCSNENTTLTYYTFSDHAVNSFSKSFAEYFKNLPNSNIKFLGTKQVPVEKLEDILNKYLPENQHIDFMNIDVEGMDFQVLESNNWEKFRPDYILIELHGDESITNIERSDAAKFLLDKGYSLIGKVKCTSLFRNNNIE